ncbi:hypothetical protein PILCRDRAFT_695592 [Piloderma croceum F 1598]|uniref:Protein kinase domain-containing protein n=1 Tax=Piloderma croceum (strain F 1598) TaxID=765440 RepID=A0A0C3BBM0_PILCF|nr:hypothetical protein PILCRDRAFT_695592 [Piloderma croceum F 1598]
MPLASLFIQTIVVSLTGVAISGFYLLWRDIAARNIRRQLPDNLDSWRIPGRRHKDEVRIWEPLYKVFRRGGLALWPVAFESTVEAPNEGFPLANGYAYASSNRGVADGIGAASRLRYFMYANALTRIARTRDGYNVAVRVLVVKHDGHGHLNILRNIATGSSSLLSNNHTLPLLAEFRLDDIVFGIFPRVGARMEEVFGYWPSNSVGDVMDMLLQALEALAFIHASNIAHRDAFHDNFLVQWHPESMRTMSIPASRPRVYLIDFEVAVEFPEECPPVEPRGTGFALDFSDT